MPKNTIEVEPSDRRVRKTKKSLRDALVSLMLERGWDAVSVKDVCERADVGRSTFYVHFVDKEDLLLSGFDDLHRALTEPAARVAAPFGFAESLIAHARENVRLYRALIGRKSGRAMQRRFHDVVAKITEAELERLGVKSAERLLTSHFLSGGFIEVLVHWLEHPARTDADALAATFRGLALGALSELRSTRSTPPARAVTTIKTRS